MEIGSDRFPRFNCAAHNLNLAVRRAVTSSAHFNDLVNKCSNYIKNVRKSKHLYGEFRDMTCTLSRQNFTTWNSTYRMLFSLLKANKAGLFEKDNLCPVEIKDLEIYFQILKPVFPNGNLDGMVCTESYHDEFRKILMKHIISKLNSKIYLVASVLNVITHKKWKDRSFGKAYFENGLKSIRDVVFMFKKVVHEENISESLNAMSLDDDVFRKQNNDNETDGLKGLDYITRSSLSSQADSNEFSK
ncbi:unnamed protein product [Brachionus calyciflorus]|uniref:Uncharacterized protein n=1 Tax=Brachionus calyciflorus TaxID=104777 RepID=A0A814EIK1_9BILA|nr:unnamed protein product [Brachionus calyciflorus]